MSHSTEAAKAAAQADYASRIRSALVATPPAERVVREYAQERHDATPEPGAFNAGFRRAMKNIVAFCDARSALVEPGVEAEGRIRVPVGQTPLTDKLGRRYLDVIREGEKARDEGKGSPYHGHSLEHCLHATGWVQRDLRLALDATKSATPPAEAVVEALPNWNGWRSIDTAPEDWRVILATAGGWVGEAIMLRDEDTGEQVWTWVDTGKPSLHSCYGWMPLPAPLVAPVLSDLRPGGFDGPTGAE